MKAKARSIDISPSFEVELGAAQSGDAPWVGITEPLEASILALWPGLGEPPMIFVSVDLLYAGKELRQTVEQAAPELSAERIFLAASHTHRAPMTDSTKPSLGNPNPQYVENLQRVLRQAVRELLTSEPTEDVSLNAGISIATHSVNRRIKKFFFLSRSPRFNAVIGAPNFDGATDETVLTVTVLDDQNRPIAVIWNYACHPVGFHTKNTISAHFPYVVRRAIRRHFDVPGLPVLYFQGFSGNTRPVATATLHTVVNKMRRVVSGPVFEDMTVASYEAWATSLSDVVVDALSVAVPTTNGPILASRLLEPGTSFASGLDEQVSFQSVYLGPDIALVAVAGEVMAEYAPRVRALTSSKFTMCVGCLDQTFGYVPTARIVEEGGYEGGEYCHSFGIGELNPEIEKNVMRGLRQVLSI